jgi:predicted Ser/Thr protein kinase
MALMMRIEKHLLKVLEKLTNKMDIWQIKKNKLHHIYKLIKRNWESVKIRKIKIRVS